MKGAFLSRCISWVVLMALLVLGVGPKLGVLADSGATRTVCAQNCDYTSIQAAINEANAGDTIRVQAGTYNEYLSITKSIILEGIGTNQVTLNATVTNGYGVYIKANSVTVKGLTIIGNSSTYYGIKAEGSSNLTLEDLVVKQYGRSGIDLNGCTNSLIDTVTAQANGGAGIAITNSTAITMQYLTTSDNSWGGVALFTAPGPYTPGLSNITLTGTNSFGEVNPLYVQLADASHPFTGFSQNEFAYIVRNTAAPLFTWYQKDTDSVLSFINAADSVSPRFRNTAAIQRLSDHTFHVLNNTLKIQPAIDLAAPGGTVYVYPGTYTENVRITKNISLLSTAGRETTTIQGISGQGALGTLWISNNTTGVKIGDVNQGFKIVGIDNNDPAVENAAIYFQGSHSNAEIKGNEIVADGDLGLLTEAGATISGFVIDSNIFSGKTFQGDTPAGDGFGQQFELPNVPRQLVVINGPNASSVTFTNNQVTGTAGGFNANNQPQGNTLVTIDAQNSTVEGNIFEGTTSRYATSLRARKAGTTIQGNVFRSTGLLSPGTGHLYLENNAIDSTLITNNTFDKGVYIENPNGGTVGISVRVFAAGAPSNSVIHILPGTYEEQVVVTNKTLTLQGEGTNQSDVVIKSPTTLTAKFTTSVDNKPVVLVQNDANVTLRNLTVDGAGRGNGNYRFIGIGFYNAGGTVENVTIKGVRETPFSGSQHGTGIYAYNGDGTSRALTVRNTTVIDFQKNGITVVGGGLTATIENNTITGAGATPTIAQNGIQVSDHAAATVKGNTIKEIAYSGSGWVSTGILVYGAGTTTVENNTLTTSQANIYVVESSATVRQNRISNPACVGEGCYGIVASDPLSARPSPLEEALVPTAPAQPNRSGGFTLLGGTNPLDTVTVTANEISGALYDSGESIGLGVYEGYYADRDVAFSASQNVISGWSYGVYVGRCNPAEDTCYSGRLRTFALNANAITDNNTGMQSDIPETLNAERNWWGSARGPQVTSNPGGDGQPIAGNLDYVPWLCDGTDAQLDQIGFQPASNAATCTNVPTRLRFIVQPPNRAFTNEPFTPPPAVRVEDAYGNLAINYDNDILIALANNPAGGTLGGTLAVTPTNGVATFDDLYINKAGTDYRLIATSGNLYAARSNFFNVVDPSADLSLSLSAPSSVNAGASFAYTLTVSNAGPKAAQWLTLTLNLPAGVTYQSASGSGWTCNHSDRVVTCTADSLASNADSTVTVNVTAPAQAGSLSAEAEVRAASPSDPNTANNRASAETTVVVVPPTGGVQIYLPLIMR